MKENIVGVNKPCLYCGRTVTCNQPDCTLRGHTCPWNGSRRSYDSESYDCRPWIAMIKSNIPCYKHLEYYANHKDWEMWKEHDYIYQTKTGGSK